MYVRSGSRQKFRLLFGVWRTIDTAYLEFELGRGANLVPLLVVVEIGSVVLADLFDDIV